MLHVYVCHLKRSGERRASADMGALALALGVGLDGTLLLTEAPSEYRRSRVLLLLLGGRFLRSGLLLGVVRTFLYRELNAECSAFRSSAKEEGEGEKKGVRKTAFYIGGLRRTNKHALRWTSDKHRMDYRTDLGRCS